MAQDKEKVLQRGKEPNGDLLSFVKTELNNLHSHLDENEKFLQLVVLILKDIANF